jgi:hypothetical protein
VNTEGTKEKTPNSTKKYTWKIRQRLVQRVVERGVVVSKILPQRVLGLGLVEVGRRRAGLTPLLLWACDDGVRGRQGGA